MPDWKGTLDAVKAECLGARWSMGVDLARRDAVSGASRDGGEWTFRVRLSGDAIAPTVTLFPEDREWDCDCEGPCDPCEHVAACAIAAAQVGGDAAALFERGAQGGSIRYELARTRGSLRVERYLEIGDGAARRVDGRLLDWLTGLGGEAGGFEPTREDLEVDRVLLGGAEVDFERAPLLLAALVGAADVRLEGTPVRTSTEPLFPRARVEDARGGGVELVIEAEPAVSEVVAPGVLRAGDRLHPFGAGARFGRAWERLPFRRTFARDALGELVDRVLPELERHVAVDVRTERLPGRAVAMRPWVAFEIDTGTEGTDVVARLVYGDPPVARVEGERLVHLGGAAPRRDQPAEKQLVLRLRERNLVPDRRVRLAPADAARLLSDLRSFDDGRPDGARARRAAEVRVELAPRVRTGAGGEDVEVVFEAVGGPRGEAGTVDAAAVLAAWRQGLGLVPLVSGGFAKVPEGWLERHGHLLADLLAAREQGGGRIPRAALPLVGELCDVLDAPPPFELARLRTLLEDETEPDPLPRGFRGALRAYQRQGVAWLARRRDAGLGAILADDMGLGKTVQALCAVRGRTLVVCPRSVIHNWTNEARRFRPDLSIDLYHGPGRRLGDADLTLTTYATLRNDIDVLAEVGWSAVVLDEAQAIKNPDSQVARAAYRLSADFRLSLSGTPVENRLDELWSQMHFANRGLLGGRSDFAERYEKPMLAGDAAAGERLRARTRPFLLRRLKRDVAPELPPRTDVLQTCELDDRERALYDAVRLSVRADVVKRLEAGSGALAVLEALLRLRQAACHPSLLPGEDAPTSSKVEAACELLEDAVADGHKALVFSQWTSLLDLVEPQLEARAIAHTRLDGRTRDRGAVVAEFQDPGGPPVMLISLTAGGTGLNLTAADHVLLLDPWWNPAVEDQAADRAHRIGQDRPVFVYRFVAKDTVEERVLDLQQRKRRIAESALGESTSAEGTITREEILALLD